MTRFGKMPPFGKNLKVLGQFYRGSTENLKFFEPFNAFGQILIAAHCQFLKN